MHCKQIAKQTKGEITEINLKGLICDKAEICRRNGICVLSPFARPELSRQVGKEIPSAEPPDREKPYPDHYEVLGFKHSLGFQWIEMNSLAEAVRAIEQRPADEDQPRLVRRTEYFILQE